MNIFALHEDPIIAAQRICDKHLVKMPLESTQLWSSVARRGGILDGYKETHITHPCCIWLQLSKANREWFYIYTGALFDEFEYRRNKEHASRKIFEQVAAQVMKKKDNWFAPTLIKKPDPLALKWYEALDYIGFIKLYKYDKTAIDIQYYNNIIDFIPWYQAMPEECRSENPVQGYINYYKTHKKNIAEWNWVPSRGEWYEH